MGRGGFSLGSVVIFFVLLMTGNAEDQKKDNRLILKYDFSSDVITTNGTGEFGFPQFMKKPGMAIIGKGKAVAFDGKESFVLIPKSESLHLNDGATIQTVVKFNDAGIEGGKADAHDMMLFKDNEFLFGRSANTIYFNMMSDKKWAMTCNAPFKSDEWVHLAVTLTKSENTCTVKMYINGSNVFTKDFTGVIPDKSSGLINIGKGWGGPWFMNGDMAEISIYSAPLVEVEIVRNYKSSPYVDKQQ